MLVITGWWLLSDRQSSRKPLQTAPWCPHHRQCGGRSTKTFGGGAGSPAKRHAPELVYYGGRCMIVSTVGNPPRGLGDLICAARSFDDVQSDLLPALADDLDAKSPSFPQLIHDGDPVQLGHNVDHRGKPESHHTWRQQFRCLDSVAAAPPIPAGTGQAFSL